MNFLTRSLASVSPSSSLASSNTCRCFLWQCSYSSKRFMSKFLSKAAKKRLPLTTKRARKGYYKGNRATKEGRINSKGRFIVDPNKRLELVVPDLTGFKLKPYIARTVPKVPPEQRSAVE